MQMLRCLWVSRDLPFPLDAGDKIYSANLARSLANAGAYLRFAGFPSDAEPPADWPIEWLAVRGEKRHKVAALLSARPIQASQHATRAYRSLIKRQLVERWDAIIFDSYGSGWALRPYLNRVSGREEKRRLPLLVYVSHNHEESVWHSMVMHAQGSPLKRLALWQNYVKARAFERELASRVGLITAITDEDSREYSVRSPKKPLLTLTPGYSGWSAPARVISNDTPRRVVIVGSFKWLPKQENLRVFVQHADPVFASHGIELDVIGEVPVALRKELEQGARATRFHGYVEHVQQHFAAARMAIVPELIGGGFKLKFLDYMFGRMPVAALTEAAKGLPPAVRSHVLMRDDLPALTSAIVNLMDDLPALNSMQREAFAAAEGEFQWSERGQRLHSAISGALA